jgi:hypothetical protein
MILLTPSMKSNGIYMVYYYIKRFITNWTYSSLSLSLSRTELCRVTVPSPQEMECAAVREATFFDS